MRADSLIYFPTLCNCLGRVCVSVCLFRLYVKSLYKRYLTNSLNWYIRRDLWRQDALAIRAAFDANQQVSLSLPTTRVRDADGSYLVFDLLHGCIYVAFKLGPYHYSFRNVTDPRALAAIFEKAEARLKDHQHPDPYVRKSTHVYPCQSSCKTHSLLLLLRVTSSTFPWWNQIRPKRPCKHH